MHRLERAAPAHAAIRPDAPAVLTVDRLDVGYRDDLALEGVGFDVRAGERVAVIGPNGAGKSTLFKTILGLLRPQRGSVTLAGLSVEQIGYVPQHEGVDGTFPVTVRDVVMMGRARHLGWGRLPGRRAWALVEAALAEVGLEALGGRQVGALSGGQRRRVFIARALAQEAKMLILDEPFSGVDVQAQAGLLDVLETLNRRQGMTILLSTHDLALAYERFDRVLALRGRLIAYGTPAEVYTPDTLAQMYGTRLALVEDGRGVSVYVDDHACTDC